MNDVVTIIVAELKPLRDALYLFIMFKTFKQWPKGLLTDKSDAIGSCNLKPNDNDNENDDNLSSN